MSRFTEWRLRRWKRKHCPHSRLHGIYGDAIRLNQNFRLVCLDCNTLLNGPVKLADYRTQEWIAYQ